MVFSPLSQPSDRKRMPISDSEQLSVELSPAEKQVLDDFMTAVKGNEKLMAEARKALDELWPSSGSSSSSSSSESSSSSSSSGSSSGSSSSVS